MAEEPEVIIYHLSDLHIKLVRLEEYQLVWDSLVDFIAQDSVQEKITVIVGHTFPPKIEEEHIVRFKSLMDRLIRLTRVIMLPEPFIKHLYPLHLTESFQVKNFQIGLAHSEEPIIYKDHDLMLLGGRHDYQALTKGAYSGALVQQSHLECINKGFIRWSLSKGKWSHEFIHLDNPRGFITFNVAKSPCDFATGVNQTKVTLNVNLEIPLVRLPSKPRKITIYATNWNDRILDLIKKAHDYGVEPHLIGCSKPDARSDAWLTAVNRTKLRGLSQPQWPPKWTIDVLSIEDTQIELKGTQLSENHATIFRRMETNVNNLVFYKALLQELYGEKHGFKKIVLQPSAEELRPKCGPKSFFKFLTSGQGTLRVPHWPILKELKQKIKANGIGLSGADPNDKKKQLDALLKKKLDQKRKQYQAHVIGWLAALKHEEKILCQKIEGCPVGFVQQLAAARLARFPFILVDEAIYEHLGVAQVLSESEFDFVIVLKDVYRCTKCNFSTNSKSKAERHKLSKRHLKGS